ncbi:multiple epidermal growth factor-like domains protein 10 isoform X2 [Mytilus trossulus]|uniref:multiple epidermal growth factor-like domains protein 10 isoform X2 n=1 Tax=Mytilus trossulus TaxID=6551 RepID=UPI0030062B96
MHAQFYLLMLILSFCEEHVQTILIGDNLCGKKYRRMKPDGQYHRVLEMTCCPDYMEVDNKCIACPAGHFGQNCSVPCLDGKYGQQCKLTCNCTRDLCDPKIGCKCKAGFTGVHCHKECPDGYYGMDCQSICKCSEKSDCDHETGYCRCHIGYEGRFCHDICRDQFYGQDCSLNCSCPNQVPCHHVTGHCLCPKGFRGDNCDERCPVGTFGGNCLGTCNCVEGTCDPKNGQCTCNPGYSGRLCNENCPQNSFGIGCNSTCTCDTNSRCHPVTGECLCQPGFYGKDCRKTCSAGSYGHGCIYTCKCSRTSVCNTQTGECTCDRGWTGVICDHKCSSGYYGAGCLQRCGCLENQHCHHVTGDCQCETGKRGLHCNETCDAGTYGIDCAERCNCQHCSSVDGVCQQMHASNDDKSTVGISVGIVAGILVLVGCLLFIIVLKRRNSMTAVHELQKMRRDDFSSNHYEDIDTYAEIQDSKLLPNYPYSYADSTEVKPPIKERQPTSKRARNIYLSVTDAQRFSKLSVSSGDIKSQCESSDYLNPYTGLIRDAKCASYQEINKVTKERNASNESESGYVKPVSGTAKTNDINNRHCNDYIDAKSSIRQTNDDDPDIVTKKIRNESDSSIQSGYLKMNSSLKKKSETEADYSIMDMDDKDSLNSVFLPKITISSQNGSTETLNIKTND